MRKGPCFAFVLTLAATFTSSTWAQKDDRKFGAWALQCDQANGASPRQCSLAQIVRSEENPKVGVLVVIRKSPTSKIASFEVIAPEGVLLPEGVQLKIDKTDIGRIPFIKCVQGGCMAPGNLDDSLEEKLKSGRMGVVTIYMNPGEGLRHLLTLDGFKEGWEALK
ncbi:MAG: invasion associated locus B family protein [Alphaproteobacteria bacterium]|nr:invasion associated locus B family protein [Alphaproteobacteria bacterium]